MQYNANLFIVTFPDQVLFLLLASKLSVLLSGDLTMPDTTTLFWYMFVVVASVFILTVF